jgi:hypothetical protein
LPVLLAGRVRLIDNITLRQQLGSLERRVGAGDRESVSHPAHASAHDDCATAVAGAIAALTVGDGLNYDDTYSGWRDRDDPDGIKYWDRMRQLAYFRSLGMPF